MASIQKICHPCPVKYDVIGRLDTLAEEGPFLLKMAGLSDRVDSRQSTNNTSVNEVLKYGSKFPPDDIKQIGQQYFSDFAMFLGKVK